MFEIENLNKLIRCAHITYEILINWYGTHFMNLTGFTVYIDAFDFHILK